VPQWLELSAPVQYVAIAALPAFWSGEARYLIDSK
jgi:hypothetical protein